MRVIKRSGDSEDVSFDKVLNRLKKISTGFGKDPLNVDIYDIAQKVCTRIYNNVSTTELDELAAHICSSLIIDNPDYGEMASRIIVSNHQKNTSPSFSETIAILYGNTDVDGLPNPLVSDDVYEAVMKNKEKLNSYIDYLRDYDFDYFGFKTLERAYLMKIGNKVIERPQHMFMRVSLGIHKSDIKDALNTYDMMSQKYFIHATPTLFNSGTNHPQLSSCFLLASEDSINGIYDTLKECANISKYAGGIGMHIHTIRAKGSRIRGTNGNSTGIIPMLRVFNSTARYVNQCFTPDTLVYSSDGLKRMDQVWLDDELITLDGSFKKVNSVSRKEVVNEELLKIYTGANGVVPLKCTQVHEIGVYNGFNVEFRAASELKEGDLLYYPVEENYDIATVNRTFLRDTPDSGYMSAITKIEKFTYTGEVFDFNMMDNHNYLTSHGIVHNSGKRNGSIAVYLEPWHADIEGFLDLRKPHGSEEERARDLFLAMWVPDLFMKRVKENGTWSLMCPDACPGLSDVYGEEFERLYESYEAAGKFIKQVPAQKVWFKILESQIESGQPYLLYKDAANKKSNQKNLGTIKSSNLCVAPETQILTSTGYHQIASLKDQEVEVWNGKEFSSTIVRQTGKMQKLITLQFSNGMEVRCTPYHKLYIETGCRPSDKSKIKIVEAKDVTIGMKLIKHTLPCINDKSNVMKYAYTHGFFCADGTYQTHNDDVQKQCGYKKWEDTDFCKRHQNNVKKYSSNELCSAQSYSNKPIIFLYGEKKKLINNLEWNYFFENESSDRYDLQLPHDIEAKFTVPFDYDIKSKIEWFSGYLDGDGCIIHNNGVMNIQAASINKGFIQDILLMLQTLGVESKVGLMNPSRKASLPDGRGGTKEYECKPIYRLTIDCPNVVKLINLGLSTKRLNFEGIRSSKIMNSRYITITGIIDNDEYDDTYCFNEPIEHKGIFNGVIMGNCTEIIEYTDGHESAVCNLASIALPSFVNPDKTYNFEKLHVIAKTVTKNLNKVIDVNFYPSAKAKTSNSRHRPIGIGVQGLADVFVMMKYPFESAEAAQLNKDIFETIYHGALEASMEISRKRHDMFTEFSDTSSDERREEIKKYLGYDAGDTTYPGAYISFNGSPASYGILQFDMWDVAPSNRYDWGDLKSQIMKYGLRNSLLLAPMPTASTSQILGFNECFEAFTSNIYKRKTLAGEFILVNKYLIRDLIELGIWNKDIKEQIIMADGSIQGIPSIPQNLKDLYKTVWEIKQKAVIDMAADRGAYICQSQSMNLFMDDPDFKKLTSMHFYAWQKGLKTGMYYLRSKPKVQAQKFAIDPNTAKMANANVKKPPEVVCTDEVCTVCSS